jgi:hypothetical protein
MVSVVAERRFSVKAVYETLGVARSNIAEHSTKGRDPGQIGRPPKPDGEMVAGSRRSSRRCQPAATAALMLCCAGRRSTLE